MKPILPDAALTVSPQQADKPQSDAPGEVQLQDCWNSIGVGGNATCRELTKYIHCRNCPVFSSAAARLFDRVPSSDYLQYWTEHFAEPKQERTAGKLSLVVFRLASEWLALPTPVLQEVAESRVIHSLPHRRRGTLLGLANIRGELLICVSLGGLLGLERTAKRDQPRLVHARLLVSRWEGCRLAFPVDEVGGIHRCAPQELKESPATILKSGATFTRGVLSWREKSVGCLDEALLFPALNRQLA